MSLAVIDAFPVASRGTVADLQIAVGGILSMTGIMTLDTFKPSPLSGGVDNTLAVLVTEGTDAQVGTTVIVF